MSSKVPVLVTGATGFIASHIVLSLSEYEVTTFDISRGEDIIGAESVEKAVRGKKIVLHFAAHAVGRRQMAEKPESAHLDIVGLKNVAGSCARNGAFLFFPSSSLVYGYSPDLVLTEKSPCLPADSYGEAKFEAEKILLEMGKGLGLKYAILRLTTVYGARMPSSMIVSIFIDRAKKGEKLKIIGSGTEKRNFIYVTDIVEAVKTALSNRDEINGEVFNIGGNVSESVKELAETIIEVTKSSSKIINLPGSVLPNQIISIKKAKEILGWKPKYSLRDGISELISDFSEA